jgi:hypothetical protein
MGVDPISVSAIIISSLTAVGGVLAGLHIKRMNSGCCSCEASNPDSPARRKSTTKLDQSGHPVFVLQPAPQGHPNLSTV